MEQVSPSGAVRRKWPTVEKLLSPSVAFMVQTDLDLHPLDTGHIERLNSELVLQSNSGRAPGRSSVQTLRENILAQPCAVPHWASSRLHSRARRSQLAQGFRKGPELLNRVEWMSR